MSGHLCHAVLCFRPVQPSMLFCLRHWRMVPRRLQRAVWAVYVPGQEVRKDPTPRYAVVQREAVRAVARAEGLEQPGSLVWDAIGSRPGTTTTREEFDALPDDAVLACLLDAMDL